MNLSLVSKIAMFFSSYTLMFVALAFKYKTSKMLWYLVVICVLGTVATAFILRTKINPDEETAKDIKLKNDQVSTYLVSYLLPFLGFNLIYIEDAIAFTILFLAVCTLYIKSDLLYINPTLMLLGYSIYEMDIGNKATRILISKNSLEDLRMKENIKFYELHDRFILIERDESEEDTNE